MLELLTIRDKSGDEVYVVTPKWWYYDDESEKVFGELEDEGFISDQITYFEQSEIENAKLAYGNDHTYLLWDDFRIYPGSIQTVTVEDWAFQSKAGKKWVFSFYLYMGAVTSWQYSPEYPDVHICGRFHAMHKNSIRRWSPSTYVGNDASLLARETSRLAWIIRVRNDFWIAKAENGFVFFLEGMPKNFDYTKIEYSYHD